MISVIIPTYKEPDFLDICLKSGLETQSYNNEFLVFIDGTYEENKEVIDKYKNNEFVKFVISDKNYGMCIGQNRLVSQAKYNKILVINDDHVFPVEWDLECIKHYEPKTIINFAYNIEPYPHITDKVIVKDLGKTPQDFKYYDFLSQSNDGNVHCVNSRTSRLPFFMNKYDYLALGGWDSSYINGMVADDDFFIKAKIMRLKFKDIKNIHFYHFEGQSVNDEKLNNNKKMKRMDSYKFGLQLFYKKFGSNINYTRNFDNLYLFSNDDNIEFNNLEK